MRLAASHNQPMAATLTVTDELTGETRASKTLPIDDGLIALLDRVAANTQEKARFLPKAWLKRFAAEAGEHCLECDRAAVRHNSCVEDVWDLDADRAHQRWSRSIGLSTAAAELCRDAFEYAYTNG